MKPCGYCGRENADTLDRCAECGTELPGLVSQTAAAPGSANLSAPKLADLSILPGAFTYVDGFDHPDWALIGRHVQKSIAQEDHRAAWREVATQWAEVVRHSLGGSYSVHLSKDFVLLGDLDEETARTFVSFGERTVLLIREHLGDLAWRGEPGPRVVFLISDEDDYYEYVGHFYSGTEVPTTLGVQIGSGYPHIVIRKEGMLSQAEQTLAHELSHHCLTHLPIPLWLHEGIAMRLQRVTAGVYRSSSPFSQWQPPLMWDELAERHHGFWNEKSIQAFWAGATFHATTDVVQLSYSLAEVLVHLLGDNRAAFLEFVGRAQSADAGQTAALDCLGTDLSDAVATFLGEGNWRPNRKAMVGFWNQGKSENPPESRDALAL